MHSGMVGASFFIFMDLMTIKGGVVMKRFFGFVKAIAAKMNDLFVDVDIVSAICKEIV